MDSAFELESLNDGYSTCLAPSGKLWELSQTLGNRGVAKPTTTMGGAL